MHIFSKSKKTYRPQCSGFTLIELLVTISIIAFVLTIATPVVNKSLFGGGSEKAVMDITNAMEAARQFAISNGTYTYVTMTDADEDNGKIYVATIASRDSSPGGLYDISRTKMIDITPSSSNLENFQLIGRLIAVEECLILDELPEADFFLEHPDLKDDPSYFANGKLFSYTSRAHGRLFFTRAIQFNPLGEAKVARTLPGSIQIVVIPVKGETADGLVLDDMRASVIRIAGLTGRIRVFRQ